MNGRERKDDLTARAHAVAAWADAAHRAIPADTGIALGFQLATLVRDLADFIAAPPCCDGGPQWGHASTCPTLP